MARRALPRGVQNHEPTAEHSGRDEPRFAVVTTGVFEGCVQPLDDPCGVGEIEAPFGQRASALGRVEGDPLTGT